MGKKKKCDLIDSDSELVTANRLISIYRSMSGAAQMYIARKLWKDVLKTFGVD